MLSAIIVYGALRVNWKCVFVEHYVPKYEFVPTKRKN